jgi:hypothetical protein
MASLVDLTLAHAKLMRADIKSNPFKAREAAIDCMIVGARMMAAYNGEDADRPRFDPQAVEESVDELIEITIRFKDAVAVLDEADWIISLLGKGIADKVDDGNDPPV